MGEPRQIGRLELRRIDRRGVRRVLTGVVAGAVATGVVACGGGDDKSGGSADAGRSLKIGVPLALTGPIAAQAEEMKKGFELYLKETGNKLGGVPVELTYEDTRADPRTVVTKTRKLITNDQVDFIAGGALAFESLAIRDQVQANKMAFVTPISSADDLTQRKHLPIVARTNMTSSQPNLPFGEYAYSKLGYRKIAILAHDYSYGWESAGGFQYAFEKSGGDVVQKVWVPLETSDPTPFVRKLSRDVDAVYAILVGAAVPRVLKAYEDFGLKKTIPLLGGPDIADEDALRAVQGSEAIGVVHVHEYNPNNDQAKKFIDAWTAAYGDGVPSYWGESTYTMAMWLDRAIKKQIDGGEKASAIPDSIRKNPEAFIKGLHAVQLADAPRGAVSMDAYNNAVNDMYVIKVIEKDGKPYRETIETLPKVSQFWTVAPEEFLKQPVFSRSFPK